MCHSVQGRARINSVEDLMTTLTQQLVLVVIEANSTLLQVCSSGDMLNSGATRNAGMEVSKSVMTSTTGNHQWNDRTRLDAHHDVQDEPFNKHSWSGS